MKIKFHEISCHECHQNDLTFIYQDMGPFICAHLQVLLSEQVP